MDEENTSKRKKLGIWIPDEKIYNNFLMKVAGKHGQTYGKTGDELLNAIILWLEKEEEGEAASSGERGVCTHTHKKKLGPGGEEEKKIGIGETALKEASHPTTSRERRLEEIGLILFDNQVTAVVDGGEDFHISVKGLERVIMAQHISEGRRIKDYVHTLEIKGWIEKIRGKYTIFPGTISKELDLDYPEGYIEKIMERKKSEDLDGEEQQTL